MVDLATALLRKETGASELVMARDSHQRMQLSRLGEAKKKPGAVSEHRGFPFVQVDWA